MNWKEPRTPPLLGERYLEIVAALREQLGSAIETQRVILQAQVHEGLAEKYDKNGEILDPILNAPWEDARNELREVLNVSPVALAGLGHPDYWPDYKYWLRMENFKTREFIWLSVGLEPRFKWEYKSDPRERRKDYISPFLEPTKDYYVQIQRFTDSEMMNSDKLHAGRLLDWVTNTDFPAQDEFKEVLKRVATRRMAKLPGNASETPTDKRELAAAHKIIAAMAIDGYGYIPGSARSPIPGQIEAACDETGVPVSRETILKHLRAGAKHLPEE